MSAPMTGIDPNLLDQLSAWMDGELPAFELRPQRWVGVEAALQETRLVGRQFAVHPRAELFEKLVVDAVHGRPRSSSSSGRRRASIASRARKMRDRTVPIGHCISCAISS